MEPVDIQARNQRKVRRFAKRLYPELRYFSTLEELHEFKNVLRQQRQMRRRAWMMSLVLGAVAGGFAFLASHWIRMLGLPLWIGSIITIIVIAFGSAYISITYWRRPYTRFLRQYLQERGVAVCLDCGYDLRGQTEPRCPECGQPFDPRLLDENGASTG